MWKLELVNPLWPDEKILLKASESNKTDKKNMNLNHKKAFMDASNDFIKEITEKQANTHQELAFANKSSKLDTSNRDKNKQMNSLLTTDYMKTRDAKLRALQNSIARQNTMWQEEKIEKISDEEIFQNKSYKNEQNASKEIDTVYNQDEVYSIFNVS